MTALGYAPGRPSLRATGFFCAPGAETEVALCPCPSRARPDSLSITCEPFGRNAGDVHQPGCGLFGRRRRRDRHDQLAPGQRALKRRPRGSQARRRKGRGRPRGQGDGLDLRRPHLHRRAPTSPNSASRHRRQSARRARPRSRRQKAGDRRHARHGARRRLRGRADRHYRIAVPSAKCGLPEIKLGLHPRRRRHPAPAAPRRRRDGARRHPVRRRRSARAKPRTGA